MKKKTRTTLLLCTALAVTPWFGAVAAPMTQQQVTRLVDDTIKPLLEKQHIPGMAVAVLYQGQPQFFNYGVAETEHQRAVTQHTLFELGSVSKTFTGVAAGVAIQTGLINLNDRVAQHCPELNGAQWQKITLLNLATYTAGGLPLQLPDEVTDTASLQHYFQQWQPQWPAGTMRNYSNASIGLFGALAVKNSGLSFADYLNTSVFQPLKLTRTFITVPPSAQADYAWGYKDGQPVRVTPGMLAAEAYGVKSSTGDLVKYMQANINPASISSDNKELAKAIVSAQTRYYRVGNMYQGLGWEMVNWPISPDEVIAGSGNDIALHAWPATALKAPQSAVASSWVHKTGSTNGFGAYIAFIPEKQLGIVMLANKNYPNPQRVAAAWQILQGLDESKQEDAGDKTAFCHPH
ncbi:class C beta-lactamase [Erwinia amylovora]|uniref:class C beta-lactamase n=1 Tax=Erwinia amylovora TaxID=552 RepID=UPI00144411A2|nr:class C beta-lactamase [Erwinia amylovora]